MGKKRIRRRKDFASVISGIGIPLLMGCSGPVALAIGYIIIAYTGIWWFPLIIAFFVGAGVPTIYVRRNRTKHAYHLDVGHELYYMDYPEDLQKELKKARKNGLSPSVQRVAAYYRSRPVAPVHFGTGKEKRRRIKAVIMYVGIVITAILGIILTVCAFPWPKDIFAQPIKTADYTSIFLLAGGILAIISAGFLYRKKLSWGIRLAASIMITLSIWSSAVAASVLKRPSIMESVAYGVCLVLYILFAFVAPAIAGDIRTAEQIVRDRKELKINLFELGYIKEVELGVLETRSIFE